MFYASSLRRVTVSEFKNLKMSVASSEQDDQPVQGIYLYFSVDFLFENIFSSVKVLYGTYRTFYLSVIGPSSVVESYRFMPIFVS